MTTLRDGSATVLQRWESAIMPSYGTPAITLVRGEGARVWDDAGTEYVDLVGGIAVNLLGHAHPSVVQAVSEQIATLGHVSNLYAHPSVLTLAERLLGLFGRSGRVFFCNSGAEANEAALKLTRRTGRTELVAATGAFHGRTMGALALTGQPAKQEPFRPLVPGVTHMPYGDVDALSRAVSQETAAVFLEPVLGEAGVIPAPEGYLAAARDICDRNGALLVMDEVQTGLGRTGSWFAHQAAGVRPDIVTLAKGLGGGLPIGACVAFGELSTELGPGQHGTTFGGNPVSCAAALAVLDTIDSQDLCAHAARIGARLSAGLSIPGVARVRGAGLMLGVVLEEPVAKQVETSCRERGFLVNAIGTDVIRLVPPLVLTDEQAAAFLLAFPEALAAAC